MNADEVGTSRRGARRRRTVIAAVGTALLVGCTATGPVAREAPPVSAQVRGPDVPVTVLALDDPAALAVATSTALFTGAPVVALVAAGTPVPDIGVPALLTPAAGTDPAGVAAELDRLGADVLLAADRGSADWARAAGLDTVDDPAELPPLRPPDRPVEALVLTSPDTPAAATATARASGARVENLSDPDPRVAPPDDPTAPRILAIGPQFGAADRLAARLAVAAAGRQLPGGGQVLFPARRMVALYGHPGAPALGVLGEQDVAAAVRRAKALAAEYAPLSDVPVVPAFELISTVADSGPGPDGDYSSEADVEFLRPWVDAAADAGVYVLLDLQPGRTDFLTQARRYTELLEQPHVGLALDPEWRLTPDQRPLEQIGSVDVEEVNEVITWLADLTRDAALPQKLLMVHQFRLEMIQGRERLDTARDELAVVLHADGFGPPQDKVETWDRLRGGAPAGVWWGWKNFYDEDLPTFTPQQTLALRPEPPVLVSYQ